MLQLKTAGHIALDNLRKNLTFPPLWDTQEELENAVNRYHAAFLDERFRISKKLGGFFLVSELIDRSVRTEEEEHMDSPSLSAEKKLGLIRALDNMNNMLLLYSRYISIVEPSIQDLARNRKHPVKILELASGAGGLAFAIAERVKQSSLPVAITGSDIVPEYVNYCNQTAGKQGLPVEFRTINAFAIDELDDRSFDIVLISQSMHHFSPGQLARIIEQSQLQGASLFLGLDGHRGLDLLVGVPLFAALQRSSILMLDGYTSARKFYSEPELDLIAEIATGSNRHHIDFFWPLSVLRVPFV